MLSVWLAICLAEPVQLHTCVMHGGLAIVSHAGHHGSSPAHDGVAQAAGNHSHNQHDEKATQCTCLGDCSAGRTMVGLVAATTSFTAVTADNTVSVFSYASPSIVAPHFLLPFSNGPPDASSRV